MFFHKYGPVLLTGVGSLVMMFNICQSFLLVRRLTAIRRKSWKGSHWILAVYIVLQFFFLAGYIAIAIMMVSSSFLVNASLVAMIFFFGSIFVLIGNFLKLSLVQTLTHVNMEVTHALISAVEARDKNLNGHSIHVAKLAMLLYKELPWTQQYTLDKTSLEYAALLHDIGKLGVPEAILGKDGPLTDEEWVEIRKHPQIGKEILQSAECFDGIADWVLYHHERCDGKGYLGLPDRKIPLASKIIMVADTFSALTMTRSYRKSKSYEEAADVLRECRGAQLDGALVDLFLKIPKEQVEACAVSQTQGFSAIAELAAHTGNKI